MLKNLILKPFIQLAVTAALALPCLAIGQALAGKGAAAGEIAAMPAFHPERWFLPDDELLGFVHIPAGAFLMGSDPALDLMAFENERWSETRRQGRLEMPDYYLGRFEVTTAQYNVFVEATAYRNGDQLSAGPATHPVSLVSWTDALAYCRWLERQLKESSQTPVAIRELLDAGWRITLPSEAQWERAARDRGNRIYPWGNQPRPDRANFAGTALQAVGSYICPECPFGLADMSGNVWELTRSPYEPYPFDPGNDRMHLDADALWVMRGGSFSDAANLVRAAVRGGVDPGARRPNIGFRLALSPGA